MFRRQLAIVISAVAIVGAWPSGASAASPWAPYRAADFDLPAGARCPFALSGRVLADQERIRTTQANTDGSPRQQQVVGRLVVRYVNADTGAYVDRNLTGNAIIDSYPDGSSMLTLKGGHFAVGLGPQDTGGPAFLVFTGHGHAVTFAGDGRRIVRYGRGPVEDICRTLA